MLFFSLPSFSSSLSLPNSSSCSLIFAKRVVILIDVKSLDSKIVVAFGCQVLFKFFIFFIFNFLVSNFLPKASKWFITCVNFIGALSLLHLKHLIFLNQGVLSCHFYLFGTFIGSFKDFPHIFVCFTHKYFI